MGLYVCHLSSHSSWVADSVTPPSFGFQSCVTLLTPQWAALQPKLLIIIRPLSLVPRSRVWWTKGPWETRTHAAILAQYQGMPVPVSGVMEMT